MRTSSPARRVFSMLLCLALAVALFPATASSNTDLSITFQAALYPGRARACLTQINALRKNKGLPPLAMLADMERASVQRAGELFVFFDHDRPDLSDFTTACAAYPSLSGAALYGESIATGFPSAKSAMEFLQKDKEHLQNLLSKDFTHVGIACVQVSGSYNSYYWAILFAQYPKGGKAALAPMPGGKDSNKTITVTVGSGMYQRGDRSHGQFELRVNNVNMGNKRTALPSVYLYDQYGVKVGKCDLSTGLTYTSSNKQVLSVLKNGTLTRKKTGTATLTVKAQGLRSASCTVTVGSSGSGSGNRDSVYNNRSAVTAATILGAKPGLTATDYAGHVALSAYVKGASGYVLYRSTSRDGPYRSVEEKATSLRWNLKLEKQNPAVTYYYKVRAYKNSNGKRVYSAYSSPVRVSQ